MKKIIKVISLLVCIVLGSMITAVLMYYPLKAIKAETAYTSDITHEGHVPSIHIEGLAERLKSNETRLYYMAVAEIQDGRAKLAREDGQSWWINDFGFTQFEHLLVEIDEHNTYAYEDDTIVNVWRFE